MDENTTPPPGPASAPSAPGFPPTPPPPLPLRPPPVIGPTRPVEKRRGTGWMVLAIILLVLLAVSMLVNLSNFAGSIVESGSYAPQQAGPRLQEMVREDHDATDKIAIIDLQGIILGDSMDSSGFGMVDVIKAQLKRAKRDARVKAVVLKVDSPGGEVLASDDIYRAIQEFQKTTGKPVVASMGSVAASGGYYVSAPCRWIVANEMTITGSIGVILHTYNYRGLMDKVGLRPMVYKSGKHKDMLSGDRKPEDIPEDERQMIGNLVQETYSRFKEIVEEGRSNARDQNKDAGRKLTQDWVEYADGRVLSGKEAHKLGFVDELGTFQDAVSRAKSLVGIKQANLVSYQLHFDLADFFRMFGKSETRVLKVDVGLEMPKLLAGRLYFLSPTLIQ